MNNNILKLPIIWYKMDKDNYNYGVNKDIRYEDVFAKIEIILM